MKKHKLSMFKNFAKWWSEIVIVNYIEVEVITDGFSTEEQNEIETKSSSITKF